MILGERRSPSAQPEDRGRRHRRDGKDGPVHAVNEIL